MDKFGSFFRGFEVGLDRLGSGGASSSLERLSSAAAMGGRGGEKEGAVLRLESKSSGTCVNVGADSQCVNGFQ